MILDLGNPKKKIIFTPHVPVLTKQLFFYMVNSTIPMEFIFRKGGG
jgi:hypothetical protein